MKGEKTDIGMTAREHCDVCGERTEQIVQIALVSTVNSRDVSPANAKFARVPCRVTTCTACRTERREAHRRARPPTGRS
ncbi:DUF7835 family putative zinc beta-ribbon protein [Halegenticoccus tardaugens]|uniref:DUF7835 family putative zinc beta-ribbon protein n=1 Tax=Halegenticoccus tardaugens TaxID=2071624 RepID=UPI00100A9CCE|nr:hypothetical protein [Halegenticoccus tardaugens]